MLTPLKHSRIKTAILISGRGSNMVSLAQAAQNPDYPAEIALVISNRPKAPGLDKAKELGIQALCIDHTQFETRRLFDEKLHKILTDHDIKLICLAGFMRILTPWMTSKWSGRMLNIHPSLLPKYKGLNTHQRAIDAGDAEHGCTVHWVTADLDSGDIIVQKRIKIMPTDSAKILSKRINEHELILYPEALSLAAQLIADTLN